MDPLQFRQKTLTLSSSRPKINSKTILNFLRSHQPRTLMNQTMLLRSLSKKPPRLPPSNKWILDSLMSENPVFFQEKKRKSNQIFPITFIRHAFSCGNAASKASDRKIKDNRHLIFDPSLTDSAFADIDSELEKIEIPDLVICSDLLRAVETGMHIATNFDRPLWVFPHLRESGSSNHNVPRFGKQYYPDVKRVPCTVCDGNCFGEPSMSKFLACLKDTIVSEEWKKMSFLVVTHANFIKKSFGNTCDSYLNLSRVTTELEFFPTKDQLILSEKKKR